MAKNCLLLTICLLMLLLADILVITAVSPPYFQYKRYHYKKKQKNEKKIRHIKSGCEANCGSDFSLKSLECTRSCMSEHCYQEIYGPDPLEEGEIDVRYPSFKGCVLTTLKNR